MHTSQFILSTTITACLLSACVTDGGRPNGTTPLQLFASNISIGADKSWSYAKASAPEPVRAGQTTERFELRHGDCGGDSEWDDCTNDRGRTEMIVTQNFDRIGQDSWYGFSIYLDKDVQDIDPAKTHLFQWKATKWRDPLATLSLWRGHLVLSMQSIDRDRCVLMPLYQMKGKWTDFVAHTKWSTSKGAFELWINDAEARHACSLVGKTVASGPSGKVLPHWGIYYSYVSRWLHRKSTKIFVKQSDFWKDKHVDSGRVTASVYRDPFNHDWGVELPTTIAYFDEIRLGPSRDDVDIRRIEAAGGAPID